MYCDGAGAIERQIIMDLTGGSADKKRRRRKNKKDEVVENRKGRRGERKENRSCYNVMILISAWIHNQFLTINLYGA